MSLRQLLVASSVLVLVTVIVSSCSSGPDESFPPFVYATALTLNSYRAAASLPRDLVGAIPCYCGCVGARPPHESLRDCFYNSDGSYSNHAAGCDLCGRILLDVRDQYREGRDLAVIRDWIDVKYRPYGEPTAAPPRRAGPG